MPTSKNPAIPRYSLKESSRTGKEIFEIVTCTGEPVEKRKVNFLVPHRKDYYSFIYVRNGSSTHWVDMTPYTLRPNTFYFSLPQQVQVKEKSLPLEGLILSFTDEFLNLDESRYLFSLPVITNPANGHELMLSEADGAFIADIMGKMQAEYNLDQSWQNQMLLSYLRILLTYLSRLYTEQFLKQSQKEARKLVQRFKDHVNKRYMELHLVADYAALMHLSPGYLNEVIKEQTGKTAINHIHDRILLEAKRKLFHSELSVKEIAWQLGFEDAAYFNRFFKRLCDQTPIVFRQVNREMYH